MRMVIVNSRDERSAAATRYRGAEFDDSLRYHASPIPPIGAVLGFGTSRRFA